MSGFSDKVQVKYEELESIMAQMRQLADKTAVRDRSLRSQMADLESGAWLGAAATAHYREMRDEIFPALQRLNDVLGRTADTVDQARMKFMEAEQDAAALFKTDSGGLAPNGAKTGAGGFEGAKAEGSGSATVDREENKTTKAIVKAAVKKIIKNPTAISNLARVIVARGGAVADDLVNLGKKLKLESVLARGAKVVAGGAGGLIDFAFLPADQRTGENFGVQLTSGIIQGAATLNPVGAVVMGGNAIVQIGGAGLAFGAEKFGEVFDVDTSGFVEGVNDVKDTLNIDKHVDGAVQFVVDGAQDLIDRIF
jgi:WXG100 family type VII secretion target